jgi:hypothetical protein
MRRALAVFPKLPVNATLRYSRVCSLLFQLLLRSTIISTLSPRLFIYLFFLPLLLPLRPLPPSFISLHLPSPPFTFLHRPSFAEFLCRRAYLHRHTISWSNEAPVKTTRKQLNNNRLEILRKLVYLLRSES